jgi:hypothetical protein
MNRTHTIAPTSEAGGMQYSCFGDQIEPARNSPDCLRDTESKRHHGDSKHPKRFIRILSH